MPISATPSVAVPPASMMMAGFMAPPRSVSLDFARRQWDGRRARSSCGLWVRFGWTGGSLWGALCVCLCLPFGLRTPFGDVARIADWGTPQSYYPRRGTGTTSTPRHGHDSVRICYLPSSFVGDPVLRARSFSWGCPRRLIVVALPVIGYQFSVADWLRPTFDLGLDPSEL